ncbi:MAG: TPM domain-containing protein [Luteolibacter sp.]|uniref:TPM domain-containing protein n=1 Tax=Luteolibacter sp. TaxID=1962973 RepID=UPI003264AFE6
MESILTTEEESLLVDAIREQELRTSAEIRVCLTYKFIWRAERYAWEVFDRTGMRNTRQRNGALIVMMPRMKKVVIIGDSGFDAVVPEGYWKEAVEAMIQQMHDATPLEALREGLKRLGDKLSIHWPREEGDVNELPDEILK